MAYDLFDTDTKVVTSVDYRFFDYEPSLVGGILLGTLFFLLILLSCGFAVTSLLTHGDIDKEALSNVDVKYTGPKYYDSTQYSRWFHDNNHPSARLESNKSLQRNTTFTVRTVANAVHVPLIFGLALECTGYVCRTLLHFDPKAFYPFFTQLFTLMIGPIVIFSSIHIVWDHLVDLLDGKRYTLIPLKYFTAIFLVLDAFVVTVKIIGASLLLDREFAPTGMRVDFAGSCVQLTILLVFFFNNVRFVYYCNKQPTQIDTIFDEINSKRRSRGNLWANISTPSHKRAIMATVVSTGLLITRYIVKICEQGQGYFGFIYDHELFFYIFDGLMVFTASVIMVLVRPNKLLVEMDGYKTGLKERSCKKPRTKRGRRGR